MSMEVSVLVITLITLALFNFNFNSADPNKGVKMTIILKRRIINEVKYTSSIKF